MTDTMSLLMREGVPDAALLSDPGRLLALVSSPEFFEAVSGVSYVLRDTDAQGEITYSPLIDFAWKSHRAAAKAWVEQITGVFASIAETQAALLEDNLALARNLKGSHQTTGATYELLVRQRDSLIEELAQAKAQSAPLVDKA